MKAGEIVNRCAELVDSGRAFVLVTLVEATGSTPQNAGAKMVVTLNGLDCGTVGGGRVEAKAINLAREMLAGKVADCCWIDWSLKADVGMTCGGRVKLLFEHLHPPEWQIVIFGAGHVAQSLVRLLLTLPCQVTCVDPRSDWLAKLPTEAKKERLDSPAEFVEHLPHAAYVLCMTQGHRSDFPVLQRVFQLEHPLPFVGVIGSNAKAAVLTRELTEAGVDPSQIQFHCPVGLPFGSNHPSEIAVSIAAQLLAVRDSMQATAAD